MKQKHLDFCLNYLANGYNVEKAYKEAYNSATGINGYRLLDRDDVKQFLGEHLDKIYESKMVRAETVAIELARIAFTPIEDLNDKVNCSNKLKALDLLQKQLGLQNQKIDLTQQVVFFEGEDLLED